MSAGAPEELIAMIREYVDQFDVRDRCSQGFILHGHAVTCIKQLQGELAAKEAECKGLREDAERYRWLRGDGQTFLEPHPAIYVDDENTLRGDALDAAIDAARKVTP